MIANKELCKTGKGLAFIDRVQVQGKDPEGNYCWCWNVVEAIGGGNLFLVDQDFVV